MCSYIARNKDKDVSRSGGQRKKLAQGITISTLGVAHQGKSCHQRYSISPGIWIKHDAVLPPEIYLKSAWVAQFNEADQDEAT
jgi:hypothetical protein